MACTSKTYDLLCNLLYPLGLHFWKVGSCKIYTIKKSAHARPDRGKGRKHQSQETSASNSEEDFIPVKKWTVTSGLASLTEEVILMRELQHLFEIDLQRSQLPSTVNWVIHSNATSATLRSLPVIFARCCKNIVGCSSCVDAWYGGKDGMSKSYPLSRTQHALPEMTRLHSWLGWFLICPPTSAR